MFAGARARARYLAIHVPYACPQNSPPVTSNLFFFLFPKTPGWSCDVTVCTNTRGTGVCVWSGLQRIGIIGKNILLYTPGSFAYDPSPLLLLYDSAVAFSPRARVHPALQPFYLGYLLENYRGDRWCRRREREKRGGMVASCALTTGQVVLFCFFSRVGTWTRVFKGAKPELGEFRHHLPVSDRTAR